MVALLSKLEEQYGITITFSVESEPLGTGASCPYAVQRAPTCAVPTAGPLALAREVLGKDDSPFFVLNSDVTCSYPFEALRDFHVAHGAEGTIMVTKVDEPSKYGVVVSKPGVSLIDRFVEKPVEFVGNRINAGIYIFSPAVLDRIELRPTSIEKETFPAMVRDGQLHWMDLEGFWMDVGQPKDYLTGTCLYLSSLSTAGSKLVTDPARNAWVSGGNVMVDPTAEVDPTALIGPNVVVGPKCKIGKGVRLQRCAILEGSHIRDHAWVRNSIVGWNSTVGRWARVDNFTVLGDDVAIRDELFVNGASGPCSTATL
jgi:mannose-1-phosphate guanylyltransferase